MEAGTAAIPVERSKDLAWPGWIAWDTGVQKDWFKEAGGEVYFIWFDYVPSMDPLLAEAVCHAASAGTGVPVLPDLRYTASQGHTPKWPRTFSLRRETFIASLRGISAWPAASGWKRLLLINAHFGNDAEDLQANQAEAALMLHLHPELVHMDRLVDSDDSDRTVGTVFSHPVAQTSLNGVTGNPPQATNGQGKMLFERMVAAPLPEANQNQ